MNVKTANDILQVEHPKAAVLHTPARPVPVTDITGAPVQDIIERMKTALSSQPDGVGLAAPQIGEPLRIFIVAGRILLNEEADEGTPAPDDMIFINPEITKLSRKREWRDEGCLSVRYKYGKVERAEKATVRAYDEHSAPFTRGASGLLAQIFQHEVDHLNGVLFIDRARDVHELTPEELEQRRR